MSHRADYNAKGHPAVLEEWKPLQLPLPCVVLTHSHEQQLWPLMTLDKIPYTVHWSEDGGF
jgi:hypothetical protein